MSSGINVTILSFDDIAKIKHCITQIEDAVGRFFDARTFERTDLQLIVHIEQLKEAAKWMENTNRQLKELGDQQKREQEKLKGEAY